MYPMDAFGHINPMIYIAKEMLQRQYKVIILSTRKAIWSAKLKSMGLLVEHCIDEQMQDNRDDVSKLVRSVMFAEPKEQFESTLKKGGLVERITDDLHANHDIIEAKLKSLKPDLVLIDVALSLPCIFKLGCPWAVIYTTFPSGLYSYYNDNCVAYMGLRFDEMTPQMKKYELEQWAWLRKKAMDFYESKGVSPVRDPTHWCSMGRSSPYLNFYLGPREISYDLTNRFKPLPNIWLQLEHTISDEDTDPKSHFEIPENLSILPGKLIYFSLGTVVSANPGLINRLLVMLAKSPHRFVVSKGPMSEQVEMRQNMWGGKFLDQKAILQKVDLFITHGGHNSTIEAFYYGVPAILFLPLFSDQLDCARQVEECGLGARLNPFTCREDELLGAIESLLANKALKERMKAIGTRLRSIAYTKIAADRLEALID